MRFLLIFGALFSNCLAFAQNYPNLELTQSSPELEWKTISNEYVQLIYPSFMQEESIYFANLIEHYSQYVGKSYGIDKPQKFPLIIRSGMADPNGFITLAPRRSEWYTNAGFITFVGSSEWYQTLSIHEYRHLNQYDYFNRNLVRKARYLFGDYAQQFASFLSLQSWYYEGDAVWAETKYTDAGRGRSPVFLARLKALLQRNEIPTYDQFVNGTYNNSLPNQYIYGYVLISNAVKKFGDDFWKKVIDDVANFPHPRRFYSSFEKVSGQNFMDFYIETMNSLKQEWSTDSAPNSKPENFRENIYPFVFDGSLYRLKNTLETHWGIYKEDELILEIPFVKDFNQFSAAGGYGTYTQFVPDVRFGYKGYSDIVLIDIKNKTQKHITTGKRFYNPRLNLEGSKIYAAEFRPDNKWVMTELDLRGNVLRSSAIKDHFVYEVNSIGNDEAIVLMGALTGHKSIAKVNFSGKIIKTLLPPSRNNITSIHVDADKNIFFEAQNKGYVNIFKLNQDGTNLSQCTKSRIAANSPYSNGKNIYFSNVDINGSNISDIPLTDCQSIAVDSLVKFNYLSESKSEDNFNKFPLQEFPDQLELRTKNTSQFKAQDFSDFSSELLKPHTWGFVSGNGLELNAKSDNYLRTYSIDGTYGVGSKEDSSFGQINFNIKKYYPIFKITAEVENRSIEYFGSDIDNKWTEKTAGASVAIPQTKRLNLYTYNLVFGGAYNFLNTSDYKNDSVSLNFSDRNFNMKSVFLTLGFTKDITHTSIQSPWSMNYDATYDDASSSSNSKYSSYRMSHKLQSTLPGFLNSDGFKIILSEEKQKAGSDSYRFKTSLANPIDYAFSRGYEYKSVKQFEKASANYIFPLANPDWNLMGWYYLRRITTNLYFDSTLIKETSFNKTYNSYGAEVEFESKILRILPVNFGSRYIYKMAEKSNIGEFYVKLDL